MGIIDSHLNNELVSGLVADCGARVRQHRDAVGAESDHNVAAQPPLPPSKPRSFSMWLFGRGDPVLNDEGNERRKEAFIEDARDREKVNTGWPI